MRNHWADCKAQLSIRSRVQTTALAAMLFLEKCPLAPFLKGTSKCVATFKVT